MFLKLDIEILSPSTWQTNQARLSTLFKDKIIHDVPLGINERIFKPMGNQSIKKLKERYKIDEDCKVISFGASNISEKKKKVIAI